ncbi:MAG: cardiolipin synthase [Oscillospiraceae bacterium]
MLTSRMFITGVLIAAEVIWLTLLFLRVVHYAAWIATVFKILSILIAMYVIHKDEVPAYRMGWIIIIMLVPLFGGLLYVLLGEKRPALKLRLRLEKGRLGHALRLQQDKSVKKELMQLSGRVAGLSRYISDYAGFPIWKNTGLSYHPLGDLQFPDMLNELKKAKKFIFLEYFIIERGQMWDSILEILVQKVSEGVDVRLIYDDMGCLQKIPANYYKTIQKMGIKCLVFNPIIPIISLVMNNRDHRKMMIIDGNTAFTGGINLADEYINQRMRFGHWKDTGVMLKGEAVWNFTVMFLEMWNAFFDDDKDFSKFKPQLPAPGEQKADGFVQPFCDSPLDGETVSLSIYLDILAQAKDYVYIFTPYLATSDELQFALCSAAKRGVDVRMVLPGIPDKKIAYRLSRSYYGPLLKAGVRIYEYTPGFMHAKSYVSDDELAIVGTINMDYRSLYLHFECGVLMYQCKAAISELKKDALKTFEVSHEVSPKERKTGIIGQVMGGLFDSVLRIFAPLF